MKTIKVRLSQLGFCGLFCLVFSSILGTVSANVAIGQEAQDTEKAIGFMNLKTRTLGGHQFWTDTRHFAGWRIQKNHVTGHFRLLDTNDTRQAWGNELHCQQKLAEFIRAEKLRPYSGKVVILLHGLNRSHSSMQPLADHLNQAGYQAVNFQYASGRAGIDEHALALQNIIDNLGDEVTEINFVAHSLGNIVVRHYLHNTRDAETGKEGDPRINRMVMLAPPNQGSRMARLLDQTSIFQTIAGKSGVQLGGGWKEFQSKLATPQFQFAIIAGGNQTETLLGNPLLDGQDDLTVSVAETRLPGAHDMIVKPFSHTFIMQKPETLEMTLRFFQEGYLVSEAERAPLESEKDR